MGFGTGVDYRQSLWLPVSFCPKILKSNAFRHTISEGILNLLEGSDAIYGVIVTRHAADRMLERGGLNRKSIQRIANQVYSNGYPIERTKGRLRKWMYKISKSNSSAQNLRICGDKLYIFSNDVLITVFKIAFCRLIPCKIDAEGKKYGNYHNHILYMETRNLIL